MEGAERQLLALIDQMRERHQRELAPLYAELSRARMFDRRPVALVPVSQAQNICGPRVFPGCQVPDTDA